MEIKTHLLKHFNSRPEGVAVDTVVVHCMNAKDYDLPYAIKNCIAVLDALKLSAHYVICRNGDVWQLVGEVARAWHAGTSKLPFPDDARENVNNFSIGIELIGDDELAFSELQYQSLAELISEINSRQKIKYVIGHEHIAPMRKTDPGIYFSWEKLRDLCRKPDVKFGLL